MSEHSRLTALCTVPTLMLVMSWVTVMLRCWVKKRILKTFTLDDWFMLLSLALFTGMVSLQYKKTSIALGQHINDLTPDAVMEFLKLFYISQIIYILLTIFIKTSISIFLLRISLSRTHKLITHVTLGIYGIASLYFVTSIVVQCSPVAFFWDKTIPGGGTCKSNEAEVANTLASATLSAVTDLVYSLLPLWLIRNLHMGFGSKFSVAIILSMGLLSTAATCVRFKYIIPLTSSTDFTYDVYGIEIWSTIEPGLGITAASAATLRPLLRLLAAKVGFGSTAASSSNGGLNGGAAAAGNFGYAYGGSRVPISLTTIAGGERVVLKDGAAAVTTTPLDSDASGNSKGWLRKHLKPLSKSKNCNTATEDPELGLGRSGAGPGSGRWNSASACGRSEHSSSSEATKVGYEMATVGVREREDKDKEKGEEEEGGRVAKLVMAGEAESGSDERTMPAGVGCAVSDG